MIQQNKEQNEQTNYQLRVEKKHNYFYKIANLINDKFYYGIRSTNKEPADDIKYMGSGKLIKKAIEKHGKENFKKEIIADYQTRKEASDHEKLVVTKELIELEDCYNLRAGGDNEFIISETTKQKISAKRILQVYTDERRQKISSSMSGEKNHFYGKEHSPESKQKMSVANSGKVLSDEVRYKISLRQLGNKNSFYGRHHSDITKEKLRITRQNLSDVTRRLISDSRIEFHKTHLANCSKQCSIDELIFNSLKEASLFLKICVPTLKKRIESFDLKWINWKYIQFEDNLKK